MSQPPNAQGLTWPAGSVVVGTPYIVRRALGKGGMSSVYEVEHAVSGQIFALKVLSTALAERPELVERVVREAEFLKGIDGAPHVVVIIESGRLSDVYQRPYIVMERLYGLTLRERIGGRAMPIAEALSYVRQVLWGLIIVHRAGVVHRDIKPDNLFVQRDGTCTLLDFGILKALYDIGLSPAQFATGPKSPIGTPVYMAPEMASDRKVDERADIFAVGLVLAECVLGFRLLSHLSEKEYLTHLVNKGVPSLAQAGGAHLPGEVQELVRRATMFEPELRYESALDFVQAINKAVDALGVRLGRSPLGAHPEPGALGPSASSHLPTLVRRESGSPARLSPPLPPTSADSGAPTRVKTPLLWREGERTAPVKSRWLRRFGVVTPNQGGRAPSPPSTQPGGSVGRLANERPTLPLFRPELPKLEDAMARFKGVPFSPASQVRARISTESTPAKGERPAPEPPDDAPRPVSTPLRGPEPPDDAPRPVSTPLRVGQGEPTNSTAEWRRRALRVAALLAAAAAFLLFFHRQVRPPVAPMGAAVQPLATLDNDGAPPSVVASTAPSLAERTPPTAGSIETPDQAALRPQVSSAPQASAVRESPASASKRPAQSAPSASSNKFGLSRRVLLRTAPTP